MVSADHEGWVVPIPVVSVYLVYILRRCQILLIV